MPSQPRATNARYSNCQHAIDIDPISPWPTPGSAPSTATWSRPSCPSKTAKRLSSFAIAPASVRSSTSRSTTTPIAANWTRHHRLRTLSPNLPAGLHPLQQSGSIYNELGQFDNALENGKRAVELDPDMVSGYGIPPRLRRTEPDRRSTRHHRRRASARGIGSGFPSRAGWVRLVSKAKEADMEKELPEEVLRPHRTVRRTFRTPRRRRRTPASAPGAGTTHELQNLDKR